MQVQYFGHSAFAVHHGEHTILVDPWLNGNPHMEGKSIPSDLKPTTILLTHGHFDHLADAEALAKQHGAPIVGIFELATYFQEKGCPANPCGMGGRVNHPWGWSKLVPAFHSSSHEGRYLGMPCGIMFEIGGVVFYDAGDTCVYGDMKLFSELYRPQVAFLPIGGHFTMDIFEAVKATELIGPEVVIPIHYDTFPPIAADANDFKSRVESLRTGARVQVMKALDTWEVEVGAKAR